jgi:hypothetical protein
VSSVIEILFPKMHGISKVAARMQFLVKDLAPCS